MQYLAELIEGFAKKPGDSMLSKMVHDDGPDGRMSPSETRDQCACCCSSPVMIPRSTRSPTAC